MKKRYQYFDADGEISAPAAIACDCCGCDCEAESYLVGGEEDFCPKCYREKDGISGEHQKFGEPVPVSKVTKKSATKKKAATKKSSTKKAAGKKASGKKAADEKIVDKKKVEMEKLITHTPASDVLPDFVSNASDWPLWDSDDHPQEPPGSGKFPFNYNGNYASERVLIVSGSATLVPDDGSRNYDLEAGDSVFFHHGFACGWTIHERMKKRYQYFDADGEISAPAAIACDCCGCDCEAESYLVGGEEDFCPKCYREKDGISGEHQKFGEPVPVSKVTKKSATKKKAATKKSSTKKAASKKAADGEIADKKAAPKKENSKKRSVKNGLDKGASTSDKKAVTSRKIIRVVPNFGGRRCSAEGPSSVKSWGMWDCDPEADGDHAPSQRHGYGRSFPWHFDVAEKAYVVEGSATLTADDPSLHGEPVTIKALDMVTFPKGWCGRWEVHSFLRKRYAFFDHQGIRIDEEEDDDAEVMGTKKGAKRVKR